MIVSFDPEFKAQLIAQIAAREFSVRTGVHCSDLIYCLNKAVLRRLYPIPSTEREVLLFSLGWATQRWLTGKPEDEDTITVDGIQVTPDSSWKDNPWELKATYTSSEKPIVDNDSWLKQIMAQCYVTNTQTARLSRLELMGNWKSIFGAKEVKGLPQNSKPTLSVFKLEFEQAELANNWEWLKGRKILLKQIIENPKSLLPKVQALPPGHEWECDSCNPTHRAICEGRTPWPFSAVTL